MQSLGRVYFRLKTDTVSAQIKKIKKTDSVSGEKMWDSVYATVEQHTDKPTFFG